MSYREENGQVVLTMSRYDYLFMRRMILQAMADETGRGRESTKEFLNRLNEGNPHYTPYQVENSPKQPT